MFGKKEKQNPTIDKDQLELIENAQRRTKQKKRLYLHFIFFLIGSVFLVLANTVLGIGEEVTFFGVNWFVYAIFIWLFLFAIHFFNVFVTNRFMGKEWETAQIEKLVAKQQNRIEKLKQKFVKEEEKLAQSEAYNKAKGITKGNQEETTSSPEKGKKKILAKDTKDKERKITLIVAMGEDNTIGKDNDLMWRQSEDLKRFKELTSGHCIIMGRKTFESFPKPLPNRIHIVVTRQKDYKAPDGVIVVHSMEDALDASKKDKQPFIIGGGEIYKQALTLADKIELTRIHATFEDADAFFPEIDKAQWRETSNTQHEEGDGNEYAYSFITYEKV